MFSAIKDDLRVFRQGLKGQGLVFYLGLTFIILYYLRPHLIISGLDFLPWIQITMLCGFLALVINARLTFTGTHLLVFFFVALTLLSAKESLYPEISFRKIGVPFVFAVEVLFLSNCVRTVKQLQLLLVVFFLCIFKMSFFGARTWVSRGFGFQAWGIAGPHGFFENSGEFSLLIAVCGVMSIPLIISLRSRTKLYWLMPITAVMTVLGASSRGGQLALLVGIVYLLSAYNKVGLKNLAYIAILATAVWTVFPEEQKARFESAGVDQTSTSRLSYWEAGVDMAKQYPWLGVGFNAFPEHYERYYKVRDDSFLSNRKEVAHNSLVEVVSTIGFPALIVYLWFHFLVFSSRSLLNNRKQSDSGLEFLESFRLALNAAVLTYFVGAFFMSVAFYPYIYLLLSFSIMRKRITKKRERERELQACRRRSAVT